MTVHHDIRRSLLVAAFLLIASACLAWLAPAHLSTDTAHRVFGVLLGGVVMVYANVIPKAVLARTRHGCAPAVRQAALRFAGWALVLGGLGYALAWMFAPVELAASIGGGVLGVSLLLALLRCWPAAGRRTAD